MAESGPKDVFTHGQHIFNKSRHSLVQDQPSFVFFSQAGLVNTYTQPSQSSLPQPYPTRVTSNLQQQHKPALSKMCLAIYNSPAPQATCQYCDGCLCPGCGCTCYDSDPDSSKCCSNCGNCPCEQHCCLETCGCEECPHCDCDNSDPCRDGPHCNCCNACPQCDCGFCWINNQDGVYDGYSSEEEQPYQFMPSGSYRQASGRNEDSDDEDQSSSSDEEGEDDDGAYGSRDDEDDGLGAAVGNLRF